MRVAAVVPCYRVSRQILQVISSIGPEIHTIYCIDDECPEKTADLITQHCSDPRVKVIRNKKNSGVGGATLAGYAAAIRDGMDVAVKIDGDGQMDPVLANHFIKPILEGRADYTKGNRFFRLEGIRAMPPIRIFGNAVLSFLTKLSSGYWDLFDPTNGYTAIHTKVLAQLPLDRIANRYFFESDMLFQLGTLKAAVVEVPMSSQYGSESSSLKIPHVVGDFLVRNIFNTVKRIFYGYFLRNFSIASVQLVFGWIFLTFGMLFGTIKWVHYAQLKKTAPTGTVMLAVLTTLIGIELILSFLSYDMRSSSKEALHPRL